MRFHHLLLLSGFVLTFGFMVSCTKDVAEAPAPPAPVNTCDTPSFANDILPIFTNNCSFSGCHASPGASGYTFENHAQISNTANHDIILKALRQQPGAAPMPYPPGSAAVNDSLIQKIDCWIQAGAPNN